VLTKAAPRRDRLGAASGELDDDAGPLGGRRDREAPGRGAGALVGDRDGLLQGARAPDDLVAKIDDRPASQPDVAVQAGVGGHAEAGLVERGHPGDVGTAHRQEAVAQPLVGGAEHDGGGGVPDADPRKVEVAPVQQAAVGRPVAPGDERGARRRREPLDRRDDANSAEQPDRVLEDVHDRDVAAEPGAGAELVEEGLGALPQRGRTVGVEAADGGLDGGSERLERGALGGAVGARPQHARGELRVVVGRRGIAASLAQQRGVLPPQLGLGSSQVQHEQREGAHWQVNTGRWFG